MISRSLKSSCGAPDSTSVDLCQRFAALQLLELFVFCSWVASRGQSILQKIAEAHCLFKGPSALNPAGDASAELRANIRNRHWQPHGRFE